jgi:predicted flap endonuclease-1-like 5' DNA nuclease
MNIFLILSVQTVAILEISALLLGAAIIGFATSWYYTKSIHRKELEIVEDELTDHKNQLELSKNEKIDLQETILKKESKIAHLSKEIQALKALYAEAVQEIDKNRMKNIRAEQTLSEQEEDLNSLTEGKHLLNYDSFGRASREEKDDLKMISGIGPFIEERLHALDIYTFNQISKFSVNDTETIDEAIKYFSGRIRRDEWIAQANELVSNKEKQTEILQRIRTRRSLVYYDRIGTAQKDEADDLTEISGIGGWINEKLNAIDIYTFRQISSFNELDVEIVTDAIEYFPGRIERDEWIEQAKELIRIEISSSENLKRISVNKSRIYYDRLGVAHKKHADNLTLINGVNLWLEERLNMLEIYTFKQISNLTPEDVDIIADIFEIPEDRIEIESWVRQAEELVQNKGANIVV